MRSPGGSNQNRSRRTHCRSGQRLDGCVFGENKVQEARDKIETLGTESYHWHFIGHLQRNKVKYIPGLFELVHSVDNSELAEEIHRHSMKHDLVTPVLIQVNVSGETSKSGVAPNDLEELLEMMVSLHGISVRGLMTIPPFDPDPEQVTQAFCRVTEVAGPDAKSEYRKYFLG